LRRDHPGGLTSTLGPSEEKGAGSLDPLLLSVLSESRDLGFLGPGPVDEQVRHSLLFGLMVSSFSGRAVDLGSGGGLPGLVLARHWPSSSWLLIDGNRRRREWLAGAASTLGMADRVQVRCQRAEEAGQDLLLRSTFDLVTARSFGPPAVAAECAAPLLSVGGTLIVSEPPGGDPGRWPASGLDQLGLAADGLMVSPAAFQRLRLVAPCPHRFPRRVGVPAKRPLF
jgi:16S rRNA (guanine527-N7)-methyltransferase